jgi:hypothetical protein
MAKAAFACRRAVRWKQARAKSTGGGSEFEQVVRGANNRPFGAHLLLATLREHSKSTRMFDLPEHRFNSLLA